MHRFCMGLFILCPVLISLLLAGCENKFSEFSPEEMGYDFYPLEPLSYRDYNVQEIEYNILGNPDTTNYFLREKVGDSYLNQSGEITYRLERYIKNSDTSSWQFDAVWTVNKSNTNLVVVEDNVPYVKMVFPVMEEKKWDGNAFNILKEELYSYENAFQPLIISDKEYDSTIKVIQQDNPDPIVTTDIRNEIYAKNIGLIYKESIILHYCTDNECLGKMIIEQGMDYRQELIGYGKE